MNKLIASVIHHPIGADFSNNGLSARFNSLLIADEEEASLFEESDNYNADGVLVTPCIIRVGDHYEPIAKPKKGFEGWMYGGNDVIVDGVVYRLHDRQESRSEYLSYK